MLLDDFLPILGRTTLALMLSALVVAVLLRLTRTTSPTAHRVAWLLVLLVGWTFVRWPLSVPWYEPVPSDVPNVAAADRFEGWDQPAYVAALDERSEVETAIPSPAPVFGVEVPTDMSVAAVTVEQAWQFNWRHAVLSIWGFGAAVLALGWLFGYCRFVRRLPAGLPVEECWRSAWQELLTAHGIQRPIPLRVTHDLGPMLCRLPRGYELLLPDALWRELDVHQRRAILAHELAHFQRQDVWKSLAARTLALAHWFNPLAWWAVRRFDEAAEWACDLAATADLSATDYARALVRLGETRSLPAVYGTSIHGRTLAARVRRLLSLSSQQDSTMKKTLLIAAAAALVLLSVVRVQLVAKDEPGGKTPPAPLAVAAPAGDVEAVATAPGADPISTAPEYGEQGEGDKLSPQQKMVASAARAFEASQAAFEAETTTLDPVYFWSVRWMNAAEDLAKNRAERAAAVEAHLDRMRGLQKKIAVLYTHGTKGGEAKEMAATNYYVAEAQRRLQLVKAPPGTTTPKQNAALAPLPETPPAGNARAMLYEGKDLDAWAQVLRTELSADRRAEAITALAAFGARDDGAVVASLILETMKDYSIWTTEPFNSPVQTSALAAFRGINKAESLPAVQKAAHQGTNNQRLFALAVLPLVTPEPKDAAPDLVAALHDRDAYVTQLAMVALAILAPETPELETSLREFLHSDDPRVVRRAVQAAGGRLRVTNWFSYLGRAPRLMPGLIPDLVALLASDDRDVRVNVFSTLYALGEPAAEALTSVPHDNNTVVWERAHQVLKAIGTQNPKVPSDF